MLHKLWDLLRPGDLMLADRYMCAWHEIHLLKQRGIDSISTNSCSMLSLRIEWPTDPIALNHARENAGKRSTIE